MRDEEGRKRFEREAKSAAKLDHPNICTVHEIDEADGRTFIAMAFLEGQPLSERIKEGPLKLPEALSVAIQMAEGLEAAHAKGITHRDIKPDNVMLTSAGQVKVMNFGLLCGPCYMSPEQLLGEETDYRTDIWGLGAVLYKMLAQRLPFEADYHQAVAYAILNEEPGALTAQRSDLPLEIDQVIPKALAKEAAERYQSIADMVADLRRLRDGSEPLADPSAPDRNEMER